MKIGKYTKLKSNKYKVEIDDIEVKLYDDVIIKYQLLYKKNIADKLFKEITEYNDHLEAYYKSLKYITKKLRTEKEIIKYLEKDYSRSIINETIEKLKNNGYLNNELYLKAYIEDQINLGNNGPYKIKDNLLKLGLQEEKISEYLNKITDNIWLAKLERIINKKINTNHQYGNKKLKEKILYDLSNIGYSKKMIEEVLDNCYFKDTNNILEKEYHKFYNKLSKKYEGDSLKYQIKVKLLNKGFSYEEIDNFLN